MDNQQELLRIWNSQSFRLGVKYGMGASGTHSDIRKSVSSVRRSLLKVRGYFAETFVHGAGNNLHAIWCDVEVVTSNILRMTYLSLGKSLEYIGKKSWKGDMIRGG